MGGGGAEGLTSPPPLRAETRGVPPRVGAEAKVPGLTGRSRRPPQPRSEPPQADRWAAVRAPAADGRRAAQCGPGRAGPRDGPLPPLAHAASPQHRPLVAVLHHCYVTGRRAGRPVGPAEKFGET